MLSVDKTLIQHSYIMLYIKVTRAQAAKQILRMSNLYNTGLISYIFPESCYQWMLTSSVL